MLRKEKAMKILLSKSLLAVAAGLMLLTSQAVAGPRSVDCDAGDSLQKALESSKGSANKLEIDLFGTCYENIDINRDGVEIFGDGESRIVGMVRVFASDRVFLRDLTITGPGDGLRILNSRVRLIGVDVTDNEGIGIYLRASGSVAVRGGEISLNQGPFGVLVRGSYAAFTSTQVSNNTQNGLGATDGSTLLISGGAVTDNGVHGVQATVNSALSIDNSSVSNNDAYGVFLDLASSGTILNTVIQENSGEGVEAVANSAVTISGGSIANNGHHGVSLIFHSTARLADVPIFSNNGSGAYLDLDSGLMIDPGTDIPPNATGWSVECADEESSAMISDNASVVAVNCTDF